MKYIYTALLLCSAVSFAIGQNRDAKRDYYWHSGYDGFPVLIGGNYRYSADYWDYNYTPVKMDTIVKVYPNGSVLGAISDTDGSPLLFTNGCFIVNKKDSIINGTSRMNAGSFHDYFCRIDGYLYSPGMMILPNPRDTTLFDFFHIRILSSNWDIGDRLVTTRLKRRSRDSFQMLYTDSLVALDTMELSHMSACRHANGRDWWLIQPRGSSNKYYKILYDGAFNRVTTQQLGVASTFSENSGGQGCFSPNGKKYARYNRQSDVRILDFDRCSGILSNAVHIPIYDRSDTTYVTGCAFSPNSRYLYVSSSSRIYQFDMQSADIAASKTIVINYDFSRDTNRNGRSEQFSKAILGPDGKIYVTGAGGSSRFMHYIEYPDSAGLRCGAVQARFHFESFFYSSVPAFPNFRLGALRGSPCDTLTVATQEIVTPSQYDLRLSPNPARDNLNIDITLPTFDNQRCELRIFDVAGKMLYDTQLSDYSPIHNVDIRAYSSGTYFVQLYVNGQKRVVQRFVVLR